MSINITDKNGDTVEILIENTNQAIETVNNQLDVSVLANLKTTVKDTLVNAINELCGTKLDGNASGIPNDFKVSGLLEVDSIKIHLDDEGNSIPAPAPVVTSPSPPVTVSVTPLGIAIVTVALLATTRPLFVADAFIVLSLVTWYTYPFFNVILAVASSSDSYPLGVAA